MGLGLDAAALLVDVGGEEPEAGVGHGELAAVLRDAALA
jgi:hypothetical protein